MRQPESGPPEEVALPELRGFRDDAGRGRHVGGTGTVVAETRGFRVISGAQLGVKDEEPSTVRILDRLTRLFSVIWNGGEGGILLKTP